MREYVLALLIAAATTYLLTPLVRRGAIATNSLHAARARDVHVQPTPLLGGLAMYAGLAAGLLVANQLSYLRVPSPPPAPCPACCWPGACSWSPASSTTGGGWARSPSWPPRSPRAPSWSGARSCCPGCRSRAAACSCCPRSWGWSLTILIVVVTINAVNFIDGLDGLAAGIVAIAACAFLVYSYPLARVIGIHSQSVPTLIAALLAGMCIGFLPHNFHPARIFMGDTGSMLLGLLLAYVPLSSTATLDPNVLTHYNTAAVNRFPTVLPLLVPVAILIIPYADLLLAVVRRTRAGMSPFAPDKKHLHHRLLSVGHSHRQSVLIIYMWAALFTGVVTSLSLVRTDLIVLVGLTLVAVLALLPVTMPRLRPSHWRQSARADRAARSRPGRPGQPRRRQPDRRPSPAPAPLNAGGPSRPDVRPPPPASAPRLPRPRPPPPRADRRRPP